MKTIHLEKLGNLRIERVLVKIDYPILFLCQNEKGKLFLFLEIESDCQHEKWVAVSTNEITINKMYRHDLSIQQAFINTDVRKYYLINHLYDDDSYDYIISKSMPEGVLNDGADYVQTYDNSKEIIESARIASAKTDSPVFDLHLKPYSHKHSISASLLAFITNKIITMFNYSSNNRRSELMVEFEPGSFVLRFYSDSIDSIFPDKSKASAFSTISKILGANSIEEVSNEMILEPKLITPAKDLINRLSKENEDFDIFLTENKDSKSIKTVVNVERLSSINNELKQYKVKESEAQTLTGILKGYDSIRKTFKFRLDDTRTVITGNWDKSFLDKKYVVHERYNVTFSAVEEVYGDGKDIRKKKHYKLIKMEPIK